MSNLKLSLRNGVYQVTWYDAEGNRQRKSTGCAIRKDAAIKARLIMTGEYEAPTLQQQKAVARKVAHNAWTFARLFDRCRSTCWRSLKSKATLESNLRILNSMIGDELVADISYQRLETLVTDLRNRGYAEGTIDRKMATFGKALTQATKLTDEGGATVLKAKPPMPEIKVDNFKDRTISDDEEAAIFTAIEARMNKEPTRDWRRFGYLIRFLLDTSVRLGEALCLTDPRVEAIQVNGVERVSARWSKDETKNNRAKVVWLTKTVIETLPYLRMCKIGENLFPIKAATAWYMWDTIRDDLGADGWAVQDVVLHTFRHTCLTRMAKSGLWKIDEISRWAGHKTIQITMERYVHLLPADTAHFVDRLDEMEKTRKAK